MVSYQFKVGDKGETRCGCKYEIVSIRPSGDLIVYLVYHNGEAGAALYKSCGRELNGEGNALDLLPPEPPMIEFWVNAYRREDGSSWQTTFEDEPSADLSSGEMRSKRVGGKAHRIRIPVNDHPDTEQS